MNFYKASVHFGIRDKIKHLRLFKFTIFEINTTIYINSNCCMKLILFQKSS